MSDSLTEISLSILTDAADQLYHAPSWMLLSLFVIAVGYALKMIPVFPNHFIPLTCTLFGTITLPLIANPNVLFPDQRHPHVVFAMMGFVISLVAWACHGLVLRKLEQKFGWFLPDKPGGPHD